MVDIHANCEIDLTVVDLDLEVRSDNVYHCCSPAELETLLRRFSSYRNDAFFSQSLASDD